MTIPSSRLVKRIGLLVAAAAWLAGAPRGSAVIIASDNFDYTGGASLNGDNGGTGWSGGWATTATQVTTQSVGGNMALQIGSGTSITNNDNLFTRSLASSYSGDTVFIGMTLDAATYTTGFMMLWLDSAASGNHGTSFNLGINSSSDLSARFTSATSGSSTESSAVTPGETYTLVAEISKSNPGAGNLYDTLTFWATNPSTGALSQIGGVSNFTGGSLTSFSMVGVRTVSNTSSNVFDIDSLAIGTTMSDVVAVPEPNGAALAVGGGAALLLLFRLRRERFAR